MARFNAQTLTMPIAAFGMVFVLGSYIYTSISTAKREAEHHRDVTMSQVIEQRKRLGIDVWDQRQERERLRNSMKEEMDKKVE